MGGSEVCVARPARARSASSSAIAAAEVAAGEGAFGPDDAAAGAQPEVVDEGSIAVQRLGADPGGRTDRVVRGELGM